jgi:transmembrane sensor
MEKNHFLLLLSRKLSGEIQAGENEQLQQAIQENKEYQEISEKLSFYYTYKNEGHSAAAKALAGIWEQIDAQQAVGTLEPKYNHSRLDKGTSSLQWVIRIAAALFLICSLALLTNYLLIGEKAENFIALNTAGQRLFKTLDDGTRIWLNHDSELTYSPDFGKEKREIFLKGEAFFDVAKNAAIPLFIHVGKLKIEVKGTAFNVSAYPQSRDIQVSLVRGLIEVSDDEGNDKPVLLRPRQLLTVPLKGKGQNNNFQVANLNPDLQLRSLGWTQDSLVFRKEKLKDLALQLERKYQVKIEIRNASLKEKRFSGMFSGERLEEALEALKISFPFKYTIADKLVIIE